mmetsp:Transcript_53551/g.130874  ORF Transcript_53551/g.130874 Transcript_53551/m.130874 type:complete len:208 (-) Transcript_53551:193-816(-)
MRRKSGLARFSSSCARASAAPKHSTVVGTLAAKCERLSQSAPPSCKTPDTTNPARVAMAATKRLACGDGPLPLRSRGRKTSVTGIAAWDMTVRRARGTGGPTGFVTEPSRDGSCTATRPRTIPLPPPLAATDAPGLRSATARSPLAVRGGAHAATLLQAQVCGRRRSMHRSGLCARRSIILRWPPRQAPRPCSVTIALFPLAAVSEN